MNGITKYHRIVRITGLFLVFGCLCWYGYMIVPDGENEEASVALMWALALYLFVVGEKFIYERNIQKRVWSYLRATYASRRRPSISLASPILGSGAKSVTALEAFEIPLSAGSVGFLTQIEVTRRMVDRLDSTVYTLRYLVLAVDLHVPTPHIFIDGRSQNHFGRKTTDLWSLTKLAPKDSRINDLEGDFYKYFDVYAAEREYLSALTIITPDVMLALRDHGYNFDYELYNGCLYVIHEAGALSSEDTIRALAKAMQSCLDQLIPQVIKHNYHDAAKEIEYNPARLHRWALGYAFVIVIKFLAKIVLSLIAGILAGGTLNGFLYQ